MLATLPAVAAAGFDILIAAPPTGPLATEIKTRGISQITWQSHDERGQRLALDQLRADLSDLLRSARPNVLHANSLSTARVSGPVAAASGISSVGHLRDIVKLAAQNITDINTHRRLVAVSRATRDFHVAQGIAAAKCVVAHNGVDLTEFYPRPPSGYLHRKLALPAGTRLGAIIGQLGLRKGTDVALMALSQIADQFPDVRWLIVGERSSSKDEAREFESMLRSIADGERLMGRVHLLGSRSDVSRLLAECDLMVHAARQEPLGRVLLEAAASGVAIVATDVGGTREIFPNDAEAAVLVPADNRLVLADAIGTLLRDGRRRKLLGTAARQRAESAFDIRDASSRLIELYRSILT